MYTFWHRNNRSLKEKPVTCDEVNEGLQTNITINTYQTSHHQFLSQQSNFQSVYRKKLSLQRPNVQIFLNLLFCVFWNFSIASIFWQQIYGRMSILMYKKLTSKVSKYCQFVLQKPYVQRLNLMSKDGHKVLLLYFYKKP